MEKRAYLKALSKRQKKLKSELSSYLGAQNEKNIHDLRTAIRRLEASLEILPRTVRREKGISKYGKELRKLLELHTKARDYDIVLSRLGRPPSQLSEYMSRLSTKISLERENELEKARKKARELSECKSPRIAAKAVTQKKLSKRYDKVHRRLDNRITKLLPRVLKGPLHVEELHEMRKQCKKLRYILEISPRKNAKAIESLTSWQDRLGLIHDSDLVIEYLQKQKQEGGGAAELSDLLSKETSAREGVYKQFVTSARELFPMTVPSSVFEKLQEIRAN